MKLNNATVEGFLKDWFKAHSYRWEGKVLVKEEDYRRLFEELTILFRVYGN